MHGDGEVNPTLPQRLKFCVSDTKHERPQQDHTPGLETDPRFPSGPWTGFWIQQSMGRQWMSLRMQFKEGKVTASGSDVVGDFVFTGRYELSDGRCELIKSYLGQHDVEYRGQNQDDGLWLWGVWELDGERGGFHLWPAWESDPTARTLHAEADVDERSQNRVRVKLPVAAS
jgi:hypothetical protein